MSLRYGILGLLNYAPMTGYDVNTFFRQSLAFFWNAQTSQIYREITSLEKDGLAVSEVIVQYDKPNKKVYHITDAGRENFHSWLRDGGAQATFFKSSFLMRVFFSAEQGRAGTIQMLRKYMYEIQSALDEMDPIDGFIDSSPISQNNMLYWKISADFGYRYYKMCIEWAQNAIEELNKNGSH